MRNSELLLKPQINDVFIRLHMLNEAQLDAIFLPLPLDQLAEEKGHNKISDLKGCDGYAGLAVSCNRIKPNRKAVELFLRAYNMAVDSMKIYAEQPLPKYITTHFNIDSIPLKVIKSKSLSHLYHPETKKKDRVLQMLRDNRVRYIAPADYTEGSELDVLLKAIIKKTAAYEVLEGKHVNDMHEANVTKETPTGGKG